MSSVYTFTPHPCIDKIVSVPVLKPDKKLYCAVDAQHPGGGGINVARVIRRLGLHSTALFPAGGSTGILLQRLLEEEKVATEVVQANNPTRENIILTETATQRQYRLGMPGGNMTMKEWDDCIMAIRKVQDLQYLVVSGSFPGDEPPDIFQQLAAIAAEKNARLVVDSSGKSLKAAIDAGVYLIKPNLSELAALCGKKELNEFQVIEEARKLVRNGNCEVVVVSMDAHGAILVSADQCFRAIPPVVKPKSSVGAGDSMVGGLVYSISKGHGLDDALRMGVACGTAAIMNPGTTLCKAEDAGVIYNETQLITLNDCRENVLTPG